MSYKAFAMAFILIAIVATLVYAIYSSFSSTSSSSSSTASTTSTPTSLVSTPTTTPTTTPTPAASTPVTTISGRYVKIAQPATGTSAAPAQLGLSQIQVFNSSGTNLAMASGVLATDNATYAGNTTLYGPAFAISGHSNQNVVSLGTQFTDAVAVTTTSPWVMVDLGSVQPISSIVVWNRIGCCPDRINGSYVQILDANENVVYTSNVFANPSGSTTYVDGSTWVYGTSFTSFSMTLPSTNVTPSTTLPSF